MSEIGVEKESERGTETEQLCQPLGTESEKERGSEKEEEALVAGEEVGGVEEEQVEEVEERISGVSRC